MCSKEWVREVNGERGQKKNHDDHVSNFSEKISIKILIFTPVYRSIFFYFFFGVNIRYDCLLTRVDELGGRQSTGISMTADIPKRTSRVIQLEAL